MMEAMPYTQSLLSNGRAIGYHSKAEPPTVTMPRLKAMVSGAIGGFLDVAFNFNTQALLDDNLIGQFHSIGWKMVMLGDETWIKLFPRLFTRHDGVSSFYVKDTVQVDQNVTRHLDVELTSNDWDLLILHYLGLDHVGHIGGRYSVLMAPKLKEMDEVIKKIHMSTILHQNSHDKRTLLMIVSDHGMTNGGNHGGSSYEETDSLALVIGLGSRVPNSPLATYDTTFQVDIAPTLALLFGVPIPKNSVGVLIAGIFDSMTDEQLLRAMELNSWQLLRLLQAQLPGVLCVDSPCYDSSHEQGSKIRSCNGNIREKLCCLFSKAVVFHSSLKSKNGTHFISNNIDDIRSTIAAYDDFLRTSTKWLSRKVTDKPLHLLASGVALMLLSCMILLNLLFRTCREVYHAQLEWSPDLNNHNYKWRLDETFTFFAVLVHTFSLGASSMVEEEQYIWHFLTSTIYLIFLRTTIQSLPIGQVSKLFDAVKGQKSYTTSQLCHTNEGIVPRFIDNKSLRWKNQNIYLQFCSIIGVLISGRILRGWHQGGVNWTHLPDISNWLEHAGTLTVKYFQIVSVLLVIGLSSSLYLVRSMKTFVLVVQVSVVISGFLVFLHVTEYENHVAQIVYATLGMTMIGTNLASPWIMPVTNFTTCGSTELNSASLSTELQIESLLLGVSETAYLIGRIYVLCWCLLQLLLQQPVNAVPILLLLLQILATMIYFSTDGPHHKQWVEVAAMYFLGMAGHFGLGNSNNLATVDVAGAYIGISSHSTVLAGILLFIITYASPLLFLLGMTMYVPMKEMKCLLVSQSADLGCYLQRMIGVPCLLPLGLNSVTLTAFTIILLLMRNHLFVWSVFSPKYLYICTATVSVYIGVSLVAATRIYTCSVLFFRTKMFFPKREAFDDSQLANEQCKN
ncbi:alkaline-phosphatase-like family protein isoform X2 [Tasmannia lanceolata]